MPNDPVVQAIQAKTRRGGSTRARKDEIDRILGRAALVAALTVAGASTTGLGAAVVDVTARSDWAMVGTLVVSVPGDYPTIQQAVDAVEGIPFAEVRIDSDGPFHEAVLVTESVTLRGGPGFSPTIRGTGAPRAATVAFEPAGGSGDDPITLELSDLALAAPVGVPAGQPSCALVVDNRGQADGRLLADSLRVSDPLASGANGVCVSSLHLTTRNHVRIFDTEIALVPGPTATRGLRVLSSGTVLLSGVFMHGARVGVHAEGRSDDPTDFWMEDSTIAVENGAVGLAHSKAGEIRSGVRAEIRGNYVSLDQGPGSPVVGGFELRAMISLLEAAFIGNTFHGVAVSGTLAAIDVTAWAGALARVEARDNLFVDVGGGFELSPVPGSPSAPAQIVAEISHNTIEGSVGDAIAVLTALDSTQELGIHHNLFTGSGERGIFVGGTSGLLLEERFNGFFSNAAGDVTPPFVMGVGSRLGDPRYAAPQWFDFELAPGSPMIDAGDAAAVAARSAVDHAGKPRVAGGRSDFGALERSGPCLRSVSTSHPGRHGTTGAMALDRLRRTAFDSTHTDWQWLQVDFGCVGGFAGLRRFMTEGGLEIDGARAVQGEAVSTSIDGASWTDLVAATTSGWKGYVNYLPHAWHTVPYGWSEWLRPDAPVEARYVRFRWDGDTDLLHEVEMLFTHPFALYSDGFESGTTSAWSAVAP